MAEEVTNELAATGEVLKRLLKFEKIDPKLSSSNLMMLKMHAMHFVHQMWFNMSKWFYFKNGSMPDGVNMSPDDRVVIDAVIDTDGCEVNTLEECETVHDQNKLIRDHLKSIKCAGVDLKKIYKYAASMGQYIGYTNTAADYYRIVKYVCDVYYMNRHDRGNVISSEVIDTVDGRDMYGYLLNIHLVSSKETHERSTT